MISRTKATGFNIHVLLFFTICKCLWSDFLLPCTLAHKDCWQSGGEILCGKPLLTWQSVKIMATVTVADRRWSVISAVFCTLVVRCIPVLQLQRHHRSHIPLPTTFLQKTGRASRMTVPTIRSDTAAFIRGVFSRRGAKNMKWQSATMHANPQHADALRLCFHIKCRQSIFNSRN